MSRPAWFTCGVFVVTFPLMAIMLHPRLNAPFSWLLILSVFAGIGMILYGAMWYDYNEDT